MRQLPCQFASFLYIATPDRMSIKMWGMFDRVSDRMPDHVPGKNVRFMEGLNIYEVTCQIYNVQ